MVRYSLRELLYWWTLSIVCCVVAATTVGPAGVILVVIWLLPSTLTLKLFGRGACYACAMTLGGIIGIVSDILFFIYIQEMINPAPKFQIGMTFVAGFIGVLFATLLAAFVSAALMVYQAFLSKSERQLLNV